MVIRKGFIITMLSLLISYNLVLAQDLKIENFHLNPVGEGKLDFIQ